MKYIILFFTIASFSSIGIGYFMNTDYSEKFIGFGVVGIFLVVIPLFSYHRWKDKNMKDYILNKENLDKMRERENRR